MTTPLQYVLDTDHVSLLQRNHKQVKARFGALPPGDCAVTIISFEEQLQGRLAVIRRAKTQTQAAYSYERLRETIDFYTNMQMVSYDSVAATLFEMLRSQGVRIGTRDLRIAAIALSQGATLVTRNRRDFGQVPGLALVDWAV